MQPQLRVGLVGCGKISRKYIEYLYDDDRPARLSAVCDLNQDRAAEFGQRYGVPSFSSIADLMANAGSETDVFVVLTPSGVHADNICELAEREIGRAHV